MIDIDITQFVAENDPSDFSAPRTNPATTWNNALREGEDHPLLGDDVEAFRSFMSEFGAWDDDEINNWSATECNALFIQLVSGDMHEAGMDLAFDWNEYEEKVRSGTVAGSIFRHKGRIYYSLGQL